MDLLYYFLANISELFDRARLFISLLPLTRPVHVEREFAKAFADESGLTQRHRMTLRNLLEALENNQ